MSLRLLTDSAVSDYLALRFRWSNLPNSLARLVHDRTEGNPLFMVDIVNHLMAQGALAKHEEEWELQIDLGKVDLGVPENLRQLIERDIEA